MSSSSVYRDRRWPVVRAHVLRSDLYKCQITVKHNRRHANTFDHIVELEDGAPFDVTNLQAACWPGNTAKRNSAVARRAPTKAGPSMVNRKPGDAPRREARRGVAGSSWREGRATLDGLRNSSKAAPNAPTPSDIK